MDVKDLKTDQYLAEINVYADDPGARVKLLDCALGSLGRRCTRRGFPALSPNCRRSDYRENGPGNDN
jgi:hypothetical protein